MWTRCTGWLADKYGLEKALEGRTRGRQCPDCNCREIMQDLKPPIPTEFTIPRLIENILYYWENIFRR